MIAGSQGIHGKGVANDIIHNRWVNDAGCRNTNKPGDLKV